MDLFIAPLENLKRAQIRQGWAARRPMYAADGKQAKADGKPLWRLHEGQDFSCPEGTPIRSIAPGKVALSRKGSVTAGHWIVLLHTGDAWNGFSSRYLHNSKLLVKVGDAVEQGQVIALSGNTGASTGPHLHFDVQAAPTILQSLQALGLKSYGRPAPGCGGRRNVPVEQFLREVWAAKEGWRFVGEV